jgi:hypothetical protein
MLRRLGDHGYATAALLASVLGKYPDDAERVCTELDTRLLDILARGPSRPKARRHSGGSR